MSLTEKAFQQRVTDLCDWYGLAWYHTHDSRRSPSGFPDLVVVGTRTVFVELKSEKGRVSTAQREWLQNLNDSGEWTAVWRPSDWEAVKTVLGALAGRRVA